MATKKAVTASRPNRAKSQPAKATVTTVRAVDAERSTSTRSAVFGDRRTILAAALIGEFIGTFVITAGFLVSKGEPLYMGMTMVGLVLIVGTLSGAYLNPLLTVGAWVTRKLGHLRALFYIFAQLLGAAAAYLVLTAFVNASASQSAASSFSQTPELFHFNPLTEKSQWFVFFAELLGALTLAFAYASAWRERTDRVAKALTIGLSLLAGYMVFGLAASYLSSSVALNPAIALAAQAVDWSKINWGAVVTYLAAPLIGGIIGFALRDVVETKERY